MTRSQKPKVSMKCECGQTVAAGSVFCSFCKAEIQKINARLIQKEEEIYQKRIRSKG